MSESEFPIVVHGTTVEPREDVDGSWFAHVFDAEDRYTVDGLDTSRESADVMAHVAAALLRRAVERATADMQADLAEAQADRDRMGAILAEDFPRIKSIVFPDPGGALAMQFTPTWVLGLLAHTFGELLGEAPNYVELRATHREHGPLLFTIQRAGGTTPHDGRVAAEARCADLQARLDATADMAKDFLSAQVAEKNRSNALRDRLDAAMAFADPAARKGLLAALTPETIEACLSARGWTDVSSPSLVNIREWRHDGTNEYAATPLRVDFCDYAMHVDSALRDIGEIEGRPAVAVYLDMVGK